MSNLTDYKNIWVFIETECGKPKNVGYELLNVAKPLAETKGCELVAVVIGNNIENVAKDAICYGADSAIIVDREEYEMYTTDAFAKALTALVEKYKPETLMIGATNNGRDLGPRVSCRLKTGLTADCTGIDIDEETGNVAWTRPTFGGNLMATIMCPDNRPQMGTVRPGVFKKGAYDENRTGEIKSEGSGRIHQSGRSGNHRFRRPWRRFRRELCHLKRSGGCSRGNRGMQPCRCGCRLDASCTSGGTVR